MTQFANFFLNAFTDSTWRLVFTVILVPTIMNLFQFIVTDLILRKDDFSEKEQGILEEYYIVDEEDLTKNKSEFSKSQKIIDSSSH